MFTDESGEDFGIELADGFAEHIGEGVFIMMQRDEAAAGKPMQNVVLSLKDLETLQANAASLDPIELEDGTAHWMGDHFLIEQADQTAPGHPVQSVALSANDAEVLRLAA